MIYNIIDNSTFPYFLGGFSLYHRIKRCSVDHGLSSNLSKLTGNTRCHSLPNAINLLSYGERVFSIYLKNVNLERYQEMNFQFSSMQCHSSGRATGVLYLSHHAYNRSVV